MANRYAKKTLKMSEFFMRKSHLIDEMLAFTEVGDIWGIGKQYALMLKRNGLLYCEGFY
jgi:hypothetical protein